MRGPSLFQAHIGSQRFPLLFFPSVPYNACVYNHIPSSSNVSPSNVFHGTILTNNKFRMFRVWFCPVYVLDPKIPSGQKLPHWQPISMHGVFLGYSHNNSSDIPLVLNLATGNISPQYHVVFDDTFINVQFIVDDEDHPVFCNDVSLDSFTDQFML